MEYSEQKKTKNQVIYSIIHYYFLKCLVCNNNHNDLIFDMVTLILSELINFFVLAFFVVVVNVAVYILSIAIKMCWDN